MAGVTRNKAIEQQLNKIRNASKHRGKGDKASSQVPSWAEGGIPVPEKVVEAAYRSSAHWGCGHERNAVAKAKEHYCQSKAMQAPMGAVTPRQRRRGKTQKGTLPSV